MSTHHPLPDSQPAGGHPAAGADRPAAVPPQAAPPTALPGQPTIGGGSPAPSELISLSRLEAIARGETVEAVIHRQVYQERPVLEVQQFSLWYGTKQVLFDLTFPIPEGRVTAIIGPSGCGKSTFLRCVNRMNDLVDGVRTRGDIRLYGDSIYGPGVDVIALRKRMGMVFQKPNPFPMSIFDNVVYPLKIDGQRNRRHLQSVCEQSLRAAALWDEVRDRLGEIATGLSGGQQQRLCIARAIAGGPELLLLDEPCSALDPIATGKIEDLIRELRGDFSILIVTHNMQQASRVSDYTAFLYLGHLIEYGPTSEIFTRPKRRETEAYVTGRFG
jgi:phosphate transport system ATP-binding protein